MLPVAWVERRRCRKRRAEHIRAPVHAMIHNMFESLEPPPFRIGTVAQVERLETVDQAPLTRGIDLIPEETDVHDVGFKWQRNVLSKAL